MSPIPTPARSIWIAAAAAAAVLAVAFAVPASVLPDVPVCTMRRLAGIPCPGCGLTRAFFAATRGDWSEAWTLHPMGLLACLAAVAVVVRPLAAVAVPSIGRPLPNRHVTAFVVAAVVALWLCWGVRSTAGALP